MTQKESFISQEPAMMALEANQVKTPNMAVDIAAQEAEDQAGVATTYKDKLAEAGLTDETITLLKTRSSALREAEAQWRISFNAHVENIALWDAQSVEGFALKDSLSAAFRFAYRKEEYVLAKVKEIGKGTGNEDMIQDLLEYSVLGKANTSPLEAINFDLTQLDTAAEMSNTLSLLHAKSVLQRQQQHQLKNVRDRAFTIMKETLDLVRDCGKYVFNDEPEIKKLFASAHLRKLRMKKSTDSDSIFDDTSDTDTEENNA